MPKKPESKSLGEVYKGKVVHIVGAGASDYMGRIDDSPHPLGWGWVRILDPCIVRIRVANQTVETGVSRLGGPEQAYEMSVDVFIGDLSIEIRTLREGGELMASYERQLANVTKRIVSPSSRDVANISAQKKFLQ